MASVGLGLIRLVATPHTPSFVLVRAGLGWVIP